MGVSLPESSFLSRLYCRSSASLLVATTLLVSGCHHQAPVLTPTAALREEHCWWAVVRSPLPIDTVTARFERAFSSLGLTGISTKRVSDSSWVRGGPTALAQRGGGTYTSRVVAYSDGQSTHFRQYVALVPSASDSLNAGARTISFCGSTGQAANVQAIIPREPTGEESLKLWTREP